MPPLPPTLHRHPQRVISHLHDEGVTASELQRAIGQLPLVEGMGQLLDELAARSDAGERAVDV